MRVLEERCSLEFEFDRSKSDANEDRHGIDFIDAQNLWDDESRLEVELDHKGEQRFLLIAHYGAGLWSAIFVKRGKRVRLISVRRATRNEASIYDRCKNDNC